jgi:transposase InsO family protein
MYYNKQFSNQKIAEILGCSIRTVIRWKQQSTKPINEGDHHQKRSRPRARRYSQVIFDRIRAVKEKNPLFTAALIHRQMTEEFKENIPSESTIRKYLLKQGYHFKHVANRLGYIKFQREKPNELWQIDIAGAQSLKGLGPVFLVLLLDDCSRFIMAAQYFSDQKARNVIRAIRDAIVVYGRPLELLADNGTQFKNTIGENNTRYLNLLYSLDIKAIYSRKNHPQSKGKVERIFETVNRSFLLQIRAHINENGPISLLDLNLRLADWVRWYNEQKPHRSLPHRKPPNSVYWQTETRIYRPLEAIVDWNQWMNDYEKRKVNKYNEISFQTHTIKVPQGYVGCWVELLHLEDRFEIYHQDSLLCTYMKSPQDYFPGKSPEFRTISDCGTVRYNTHWYSIDYKLAGKKVEIQESDEGRTLLVYLEKVLIKRLSTK